MTRHAVGDLIVEKTFPPITRQTLALYAGASGDHNPVHIDLDFARSAGFDDVFSQGMLVMACLGQALTDAVPPSAIRSFTTRFTAVTQLGAAVTCRGQVTGIREVDGETRMCIGLVVTDQFGETKLTGTAEVTCQD